jgi:hypothetical protein
MNNLRHTYRITGNAVNLALLAFALIPLIALSYYNHPSPADDYCYIDTVFKFSWLEAMHYYYTGWTGRYFGIFLNHSNPLLFHSITGFKVLPILLLLGLVVSIYTLVRQLTPTLFRKAHLGFAGVILFLYILQIPSIAEAFYWMAAFVTYTVPNILTLLWITVVLRWYRLDNPTMKTLTGIFAGFLVFAIIGSSETNLLVMVLLVAGWIGYRLLFQRKVDGLMIGMIITTLISCYLYFMAPGNEARLGGNPLSGNISQSMLNSFIKLGTLAYGWIIKTPLLLFTATWIALLSRITPQALNYFKTPLWYISLIYIGILAAQLFPSYYGVGIEPTLRVINCVYLFFLIGWFYLTGVVYCTISQRRRLPVISLRYQGVILAGLGLWIVFSITNSTSYRMVYTDWLKGKASAYNQAMNQRYETLRNSRESVVYLPEIEVVPQSLFVEDIKVTKDHWWNKCVAGYFGKEAIYLIQDKNKTNEPTP